MDPPINIDPDGDVILHCDHGEKQRRLRVCSKMLSKASAVFRAMLSARFLEGIELRMNGALTVQLREDDVESMMIICRIAHLQNRYVPQTLSLAELLAVSRLSDKYDLSELLRPHTYAWITTAREQIESQYSCQIADEARERLLVAAYNLGHTKMFASIGRDIVVKNKTSCSRRRRSLTLLEDIGHDLDEVFDALASHRRGVQSFVNDGVGDLIEHEAARRGDEDSYKYTCGPDCSFLDRLLRFTIDNFRHMGLWPPTEMRSHSLEYIWQSLANDRWTQRKPYLSKVKPCTDCGCVGNDYDCVDHFPTWFKEWKEEGENMIRALCYDCVREGKILESTCEHAERQATVRKA